MLTQLQPSGVPGRRYGSFAGRSGGGSAHPVDVLTQLQPGGWAGGRYGSFGGKPPSDAHPVDVLTQLQPGGWAGGRYGSFAGKPPSSGPPPVTYFHSRLQRLALTAESMPTGSGGTMVVTKGGTPYTIFLVREGPASFQSVWRRLP